MFERVKAGDRKEQVFSMAAKLIAKKGYGSVSMADIANSCNISKANLYHHFKSKEDLLSQLVKIFAGGLIINFKKPENKKFREVLQEIIDKYIEAVEKTPEIISTMTQFYAISMSNKNVRSVFAEFMADYNLYLTELFNRGLKNNEIKKGLKAEELALIFIAMISGIELHDLLLLNDYQKLIKDTKIMLKNFLKYIER